MALTDSLVDYWKLDEASGNRTGAHASIVLTDTNTVGSATGLVYALAAEFEYDNNEQLTVNDNAATSVADIDFTIAGWCKLEGKATAGAIAGKGDGDDMEYILSYTAGTDRFRFYVYGGTGFVNGTLIDADNLGSPSTATWYFVVGEHDATANTISIQVNNGTINSVAHTFGCYDSNGPFSIGAGNSAFPAYFDGALGPVMMWKRKLTTQERTDLYNSGAGMTYAAFSGGGGVVNAGRMSLLGVGR